MKGPFAKLPYTLNMKRDICLVAGGSGGIDCQFVRVSLCMSGRECLSLRVSVTVGLSVDFLFVCHCQSVRDCLSICLCLSVCWSVTDL